MKKRLSNFSIVLLAAAAVLTSSVAAIGGSTIAYAQSPLGVGGLGGIGGLGGLGGPFGLGGPGGPGGPGGVGGIGGLASPFPVSPSAAGSPGKPIFPLNQFKLALCSSPAKGSPIEPCISVPKGSGNFTFICQPTSIVSFSCISVSPLIASLMSNSTSTPTAFQQPLMSNSTSSSPNIVSSSTPPPATTKPLK
jgi:hypothetical protein